MANSDSKIKPGDGNLLNSFAAAALSSSDWYQKTKGLEDNQRHDSYRRMVQACFEIAEMMVEESSSRIAKGTMTVV